MSQIHHRIPLRIHLVEDVIPEELDGVPLARLGPLLAVFGPLGDEVELGHEAHDAGVFELAIQVGG